MFERESYLNLADEMDPHGREPAPVWDASEWEPEVVEWAEKFALRHGLPFPPLDGIDVALERVDEIDKELAR